MLKAPKEQSSCGCWLAEGAVGSERKRRSGHWGTGVKQLMWVCGRGSTYASFAVDKMLSRMFPFVASSQGSPMGAASEHKRNKNAVIPHLQLEVNFTPWPAALLIFPMCCKSQDIRAACSFVCSTLLWRRICQMAGSCPMFTDSDMILQWGTAERAGLPSWLSHWYYASGLVFILSSIKLVFFLIIFFY